jgi:hypothetical protein
MPNSFRDYPQFLHVTALKEVRTNSFQLRLHSNSTYIITSRKIVANHLKQERERKWKGGTEKRYIGGGGGIKYFFFLFWRFPDSARTSEVGWFFTKYKKIHFLHVYFFMSRENKLSWDFNVYEWILISGLHYSDILIYRWRDTHEACPNSHKLSLAKQLFFSQWLP